VIACLGAITGLVRAEEPNDASQAILAKEILADQNKGSDKPGAPEGVAIVQKYEAVFTTPPKKIPSKCSTDAPLLGNGDLLVALGGVPERTQFYIGKADLWELRTDGGPRPLARLEVDISTLKGASYRVMQDLRKAITTGVFTQGEATLTMELAVAATENLLWVKISSQGCTFEGKTQLFLPGGKVAEDKPCVRVVERQFEKNMLRPSGAACAVRILRHQGSGFTVTPEKPVFLLATASGLANMEEYRADAIKRAALATQESLTALRLVVAVSNRQNPS
jgi:alpha-L-fucosidase 2